MMGLTRQYLRFVPGSVFGVVGSISGKILFLNCKGTKGRYAATASCENVNIWDTKTGDKLLTLQGEKHEVTCTSQHHNAQQIAVGYADGAVRLFDLSSGRCVVTFNGHKSAVTCLSFDSDGMRLVSGGKDTEIVLWDIINEAGMFRLRGHKGIVTKCHFMKTKNILVSSSKDTMVKFWNLDSQHCFKTLVGHRSEVWDFALIREDTQMITGSSDSELRVWNINWISSSEINDQSLPVMKKSKTGNDDDEELNNNEDSSFTCEKFGTIIRKGKSRVISLQVDEKEAVLACHGTDNIVEIFKLCSEEEAKKRLMKRQRKERKKLQKLQEMGNEVHLDEVTSSRSLTDEIQRLPVLKVGSKARGIDIYMLKENIAKVVVLLNNNSIEVYTSDIINKKDSSLCVGAIKLPGHRTDARTLTFSSDNTSILSASGETVKIWNRSSQQCVRTMGCDYALCSILAPGDRHCIIGTKTGKLQIFDIGAGKLLESVDAHTGAVWSMSMSPDQHGIVSGSEDKDVKFWDFELIKDEKYSQTSKRLTLVHTRTLKMSEDVLCVCYSPDQRLLAVSLLDSTVKVFFTDTLKFFLSLYGHQFPVLCMDISSDSTLIATGSADRNLKIWGLDFGDCHKSIFAHDDSIMCLQFIPKTHMFFTGSKDKTVKQWDADNFQKILTLQGHQAEVWALAISPNGQHVVSAAHDRSLRLWEKTQEPLILEEEEEMEREAEFEKGLASGEQPVIPGEVNQETGLAGKKTVETVKAAETLMEALDVYKEEVTKQDEHQRECLVTGKELPLPPPHPLMTPYSTRCPRRYMLEVIRRTKSSELEEALLVLPFHYVSALVKILKIFLDLGWDVELSCRVLFFLLRIHCSQITANHSLLPVIDQLRRLTLERVTKERDIVGFNLAGLQFLQREFNSREEVALFADATQRLHERKKRLKKKERALLVVN
ncbi:WD repeat-containing protein 3 [Tachypleus tridentatus]|uniref:WD repeat-containing protein 3 n=1 Tax=Tachypleus tridentatus TaxID=6853 RepID=UPI003FD1B4AE